ncbi:MAG: alanine racemase [Deltaproteobacteria bacterium]|nr:alanine racemase [Deltaproteobacteria bacterium]
MKNSYCSHYAWAEIDLDALSFNLTQVRNLVGKEKKILAVVKANAYGHGLVPVAHELEALGIDFFGVAFLEEGVRLRTAGITKPIVILGGVFPSQGERVIAFNLTPVVYDLAAAQSLEAEGRRQRKRIPVHIKIDTGMNRLGVPDEAVKEFFVRLKGLDHLEIEGILSHFSSVHLRNAESQRFTKSQAERYRTGLAALRDLSITAPLLHMGNSASIIEGVMPELTMVRAGLILYGAYPSKDLEAAVPLKPMMTLKATVIQIRAVAPDVAIGYGRTFSTKRTSRIATITAGYGDGYTCRLSNRGTVLIRGKPAPVVGSVCMDLTMVDITEVPDAKVGDEVVLMGSQEGATISANDLAEWSEIIPYEILCGVSQRVPRIYKKHGEIAPKENEG